jgi:hypothetical protein
MPHFVLGQRLDPEGEQDLSIGFNMLISLHFVTQAKRLLAFAASGLPLIRGSPYRSQRFIWTHQLIFLFPFLFYLFFATFEIYSQELQDIQGIVSSAAKSRVEIYIGKNKKIQPGTTAVVWYEITEMQKEPKKIKVAQIRIDRVRGDFADGVVLKSTAPVRPGYRVSFIAPTAKKDGCVGHLFVLVEPGPTSANVYLNSIKLKELTPTMVQNLPCGEHRVKLTHPDYEPYDSIVRISGNGVTKLVTSLVPRKGVLSTPRKTTELKVRAFGYGSTSRGSIMITLGLIVSEFAIEIDGRYPLGWEKESLEGTVPISPGRHLFRIVFRDTYWYEIQSPARYVLYEKEISVGSEQVLDIEVNFPDFEIRVGRETEKIPKPGDTSVKTE